MTSEQPILEVKNLTKKFSGLIAVNNANIYLNKGEVVGLIGANGAGKTTLFNMISGVFPPTSGKIFSKGKKSRECRRIKSAKWALEEHIRSFSLFQLCLCGRMS